MIIVNCDGLCEPRNPGGTATYGWVAYKDGKKLAEDCAVVCSGGSNATNNVAEYSAVIAALEWLLKKGLQREEEVEVRSDSRLCMRQLSGMYAVRSPRIWPLYEKAENLAQRFKNIRFKWVPREQNEEADALSRKAYSMAVLPDKGRLERARKLVGLVEHLGGSLYRVCSQSSRNMSYIVDIKEPSCECADYRKRGGKCKHILAVELLLEKEKVCLLDI